MFCIASHSSVSGNSEKSVDIANHKSSLTNTDEQYFTGLAIQSNSASATTNGPVSCKPEDGTPQIQSSQQYDQSDESQNAVTSLSKALNDESEELKQQSLATLQKCNSEQNISKLFEQSQSRSMRHQQDIQNLTIQTEMIQKDSQHSSKVNNAMHTL